MAEEAGTQVFNSNTLTYASTLVQGLGVGGFTGNEDPAFAAPEPATNAPTTAGDYRLLPGSAAINAGDNAFTSEPTDLDGNPRIVGGTIDLGAYEAPEFTLRMNDSLAADHHFTQADFAVSYDDFLYGTPSASRPMLCRDTEDLYQQEVSIRRGGSYGVVFYRNGALQDDLDDWTWGDADTCQSVGFAPLQTIGRECAAVVN